jgi:hypothetical protein
MLTVNGLHNFYYVPGVTDMRCGYHRLMQIVKHKFHRDPVQRRRIPLHEQGPP